MRRNRLRAAVTRAAINFALRKPAPQRIPLSLPAAAGNDFYSVELLEPSSESRSAYVSARDGEHYRVIYFNEAVGGGYEAIVLGHRVDAFQFQARHYLRGYEFRSRSPLLFLFQQLVRYPNLLILQDRLAQFLFNRRKLTRHDRIEILRMFVTKTMTNPNYSASATSLLQDLHSLRGFSHPQGQEIMNYYRLVLQSFVESEDLALSNHAYTLTGRGMHTLAQYELEERRFQESMGQQRLVGKLTIALIAVGIAQALATYFAE